jgi:hypothetical protein
MGAADDISKLMRLWYRNDVSRYDDSFLAATLERRRAAAGDPDLAAYTARIERDALDENPRPSAAVQGRLT